MVKGQQLTPCHIMKFFKLNALEYTRPHTKDLSVARYDYNIISTYHKDIKNNLIGNKNLDFYFRYLIPISPHINSIESENRTTKTYWIF